MDQLKISLPEVSASASQIRQYNANLDETLSYVNKIMNELNSVWLSDTEETLLSRFQNFAQKFINESEIIENYARFLDDTVSSYDSLESAMNANAGNFE